MSDNLYQWALPQDGLTDGRGHFYSFSFLPRLQELIEQERKTSLANQVADEQIDCWDDDTLRSFVRKKSFEKFIDNPAERKQAIIDNRSYVYFPVADNPNATDEMTANEFHSLNQVAKYGASIEQVSQKYGVDPDLIRAIIYMETTHGYYDAPISNLLQALDLDSKNIANAVHKSILPMNINVAYWGDFYGTREQLMNPEYNIDAGARHLAQLKKFLKKPTIEKIASLYNNLATQRVNSYGKRVARFYNDKPWLYDFAPYIYESDSDLKYFFRGFLMTIIENYPFLLK